MNVGLLPLPRELDVCIIKLFFGLGLYSLRHHESVVI